MISTGSGERYFDCLRGLLTTFCLLLTSTFVTEKIGNVGTTTSSNEVSALKAGNIRGKEEFFVGGDFLKASNACQECKNLAVWDGSTWSHIDTVWDQINALEIDTINNELYISGNFTQIGDQPILYEAVWDGEKWYSLNFPNNLYVVLQGMPSLSITENYIPEVASGR